MNIVTKQQNLQYNYRSFIPIYQPQKQEEQNSVVFFDQQVDGNSDEHLNSGCWLFDLESAPWWFQLQMDEDECWESGCWLFNRDSLPEFLMEALN